MHANYHLLDIAILALFSVPVHHWIIVLAPLYSLFINKCNWSTWHSRRCVHLVCKQRAAVCSLCDVHDRSHVLIHEAALISRITYHLHAHSLLQIVSKNWSTIIVILCLLRWVVFWCQIPSRQLLINFTNSKVKTIQSASMIIRMHSTLW